MRGPEVKSVELTCVGVSHRVTPATVKKISAALEFGVLSCELVREPENVHDHTAIKVVISEAPYKGLHIGYLMRGVAAEYARRLDKGRISVQAWLTELTPQEGILAARVGKPKEISQKKKSRSRA